MHRVHDALQAELNGIIDGFFYCPHLPNDGCECRKPGLKMIRDAEREFNIVVGNSWMVGDKKIDVEAGIAAGMRTALVLTGYGSKDRSELLDGPDVIAASVVETAAEILRLSTSEIVL